MPRPPLDPLRFPPFAKHLRFRRVRNTAQGTLYQNVEPQVGLPLWIRYNIPGKYWEYSIDADANIFFRLKENPYIPDNAYFINRGVNPPDSLPAIGDCQVYCRTIANIPKLIARFSDGAEVILAAGPSVISFPPVTSFWKLEEATGATRADSVGTNHLTSNGGVTQVAGKIGNAAGFNGSTQYLNITDNASISLTSAQSFEFTCWANLSSLAVIRPIITQFPASGQFSHELMYNNSSNRFEFYTSPDGTAINGPAQANTFGAPTTGVWYFLDVYYDSVALQMGISVNRGSFDLVGASGAFDSNGDFIIGGRFSPVSSFFAGSIDAVAFRKGSLFSTAERDQLYNFGTGLEP